MQLARATRASPALAKRAAGLPALLRPVQPRQIGSGARQTLARAEPADAQAAAQDALNKAAATASDAAAKGLSAAKDTASKLKGAINQATLDVDVSKLLTYNFLAQLGLTAMSWAVVFFTSHIGVAKGAGVNPTVLVLMVGVLLSGYSTYLSFGYLSKSKKEGLGALDGWEMLNKFYEHMTFNFIGCAATLLSLFANLGTLMVSKSGNLTIEALAQAASNTLLAHLVSLAFLMVVTRKITQAYQKLADWSAQLEGLKAAMPKFG